MVLKLLRQPHPDPALLTTPDDVRDGTAVADDAAKVNLVPSDFKEHPATITSETEIRVPQTEEDVPTGKGNAKAAKAKSKLHQLEDEARKDWSKAQDEGFYLWNVVKEQLFRPGVAGGLIGIVNVGLLSSASYHLYTRPHLRSDARVLGATVAGALTILGAESYAAEKYSQTPAGKAEERRAREEGAVIYRHAREVILRPGVLGGLVGLVNLGVLGGVGYIAYDNWTKPHWDRRTVSAITVGLFTLFSAEG
ncbi:hypothetical protein PUNSTDRAFT_62791 [Punctularia strigosozonata HHB-11173 SS5]|uniref:uncharacterized protein n=1 Tax=Punctularia strigosozonata (strain HHB-11173) TaxID=741275 RepID=UPI0004416294|nr:uncharacterized protein PUNSTDRAFT_62791 [Punctularia strigosozonata HHB-11173 SS5]EIN11334.1 hypothetical protein PUNSTDRAFT_62791 [Punctularia strigosozonata HHB-11173 SS5]